MTAQILTNLPVWQLLLLVVCLPMAFASICLLLVRHWMKKPEDEEHNILVTGMFAAVSLIYTVLLAFLIISVWGNYTVASQAVSDEAAALVTVARNAEVLPEPLRGEVLDGLHNYTAYVMSREWDMMRQGVNEEKFVSKQAVDATNNLWVIYRKIPSSAVSAEMLRSMDQLSEQRVVRLMASQDSLPQVFWFVLIIDAVMTIGFSFILRVKDVRLHMAMVLLLTCSLTLCLWLILLVNDPFVGSVQISSEPFRYASDVINALQR
jgi:Protein of unknown function (DUF4239)